MRVAFGEAIKGDYDYYFWLNDDTVLLPGALRGLLETAHKVKHNEGREGIIVGSARDGQAGRLTYGGRVRTSRWRPMNFEIVVPSQEPQRCDTMNGNCVLISREATDLVGNLSEDFMHSMGDIDYGLRAKAMGVGIWVAPNYAAECSGNEPSLWVNPKTPLIERLRILHTPKGLPFREWLVYTKRHSPIQWPIYCGQVYLRVLFPRFWSQLRKLIVS